jgi:hypothetical protein
MECCFRIRYVFTRAPFAVMKALECVFTVNDVIYTNSDVIAVEISKESLCFSYGV